MYIDNVVYPIHIFNGKVVKHQKTSIYYRFTFCYMCTYVIAIIHTCTPYIGTLKVIYVGVDGSAEFSVEIFDSTLRY